MPINSAPSGFAGAGWLAHAAAVCYHPRAQHEAREDTVAAVTSPVSFFLDNMRKPHINVVLIVAAGMRIGVLSAFDEWSRIESVHPHAKAIYC